jgi:uncharacterized damage-inducible protein DinB
MIDDYAKAYLHDDLRWIREALLAKLDGLTEYDIRRPLTPTGTNLLGLVKHLSTSEARYFGEVFERPFQERLPRWDDETERRADMWATEQESRAEIIERYRRACAHADETIDALDIGASGQVPWWPRPEVKLFNILVHVLTETNRHAGHADILREQLDGAVGVDAHSMAQREPDAAYWENRRAEIERSARAANPTQAPTS